MTSNFLLYSRDRPLASSLVIVLVLGSGLALGLFITTKALDFIQNDYFLYIEMTLLQKFRPNSYCVGGTHSTGTNNI